MVQINYKNICWETTVMELGLGIPLALHTLHFLSLSHPSLRIALRRWLHLRGATLTEARSTHCPCSKRSGQKRPTAALAVSVANRVRPQTPWLPTAWMNVLRCCQPPTRGMSHPRHRRTCRTAVQEVKLAFRMRRRTCWIIGSARAVSYSAVLIIAWIEAITAI